MKRIEIYIGLSVFALSAKSQVKESRPNVIYIIMDDLGYGDIGCYGSEKIEHRTSIGCIRMASVSHSITQVHPFRHPPAVC